MEQDGSTPLGMPHLTERQERVVACVQCILAKDTLDVPITVAPIRECTGLRRTDVNYALRKLETAGVFEAETQKWRPIGQRGGSSPVIFTPTQRGAVLLRPLARKDCPLSTPNSLIDTTDEQKRLLSCVGCILARAEEPTADGLRNNQQEVTSEKIAYCTGMPRETAWLHLSRFATMGLFTVTPSDIASVARSGRRPNAYAPTEKGKARINIVKNPDCQLEEREVAALAERLSPNQQRMLGCFACINEKLCKPGKLPGATTRIITQCRGAAYGSVYRLMSHLTEAGFVSARTGYTGDRSVFYAPLSKGERLLAAYSSDQEQPGCVARNFDGTPRIDIYQKILECSGCILAQQAANGDPPGVTQLMIEQCSSISRSTAGAYLENLAGESILQAERPPHDPLKLATTQTATYIPGTYGDVLSVTRSADCKLDLPSANAENLRSLCATWKANPRIKEWVIRMVVSNYPEEHRDLTLSHLDFLIEKGLVRRVPSGDLKNVPAAAVDHLREYQVSEPLTGNALVPDGHLLLLGAAPRRALAYVFGIERLLYGSLLGADRLSVLLRLTNSEELVKHVQQVIFPRVGLIKKN